MTGIKLPIVAICASMVFAFNLFAQGFPDPVDGVVTLPAGTYDGTIPANTTKLVVDVGASEKVEIGGDNSDFTGLTEIMSGTLLVKSRYALGGANATVSVSDGGRLELSFAQPDSVIESTQIWMPHTIIKGSGISENGAFKASFIGEKNCDNGVRSLELSGDATVDLSVDSAGDKKGKRWGVNSLTLNGHTITRINSAVDLVMKNNTITPGHFVNNAGVLLFQLSKFSGCTIENTSFTINDGSFKAWENSSAVTKIPGVISLKGGKLDFETSTGASYFAAPVKFFSGSGITSTSATYAKKVAHFQRGLENNSESSNFSVKSYGTNYISELSSAANCKGFDFSAGVSFVTGAVSVAAGGVNATGGSVTFDRDVVRSIGGGVKIASGGVWSQFAGKTDTSMLRIDNGNTGYGTFRLSGGSFSTRTDSPYCGETQNGLGVFVQEGGEFVCSNTFTLAKRTGGFGMIVQKGGSFGLWTNSEWGKIAVGVSGDGRYYHLGGTNIITCTTKENNNPRTHLGGTNGLCQLVISGKETVFETQRLVAGNANVPSTNVVAVMNGGTLKAARIVGKVENAAQGTVSALMLDGGVICPLNASGFSGLSTGSTFFNRNFTHAVVGEGGVAIDTSECLNDSGVPSACLFPHIFSAPSGCGIATITIPDSVKSLKYKGPVPIVIEGNGYGAAAFADFDYAGMCISTAVVLSAGCDYDESTKVYVLEAKATSAPVRHECEFTLTSGSRTAGPLTKRGAQTLKLYGVQAWGEETIIESGELMAVDKGSVPDGLKLTVLDGATLNLNTNDLAVAALAGAGTATATNDKRGNITIASGGTIEVDAADMVAGNYLKLAKGMLTVVGSATIKVLDPDSLLSRSGKFTVLSAAKGITLAEGASIALDPDSDLDGEWRILNRAGQLSLHPAKGFVLSFR